MDKSQLIKTIYVYVLLIISIVILMVNSVSALSSVVDIIYPTPYLQTYDEFVTNKQNSIPIRPEPIARPIATPDTQPTATSVPTREEYEQYKIETTNRELRDITKRIIKDFIWVIASGILLWFALREKKALGKK